MKYQFQAGFWWDNGCAGYSPDPFEAESIDEVCNKVISQMREDTNALHAEDFSLEVYDENDNEVLWFGYDVKLRKNVLYNEEEEMLNELRKELKEEVFKDE